MKESCDGWNLLSGFYQSPLDSVPIRLIDDQQKPYLCETYKSLTKTVTAQEGGGYQLLKLGYSRKPMNCIEGQVTLLVDLFFSEMQ